MQAGCCLTQVAPPTQETVEQGLEEPEGLMDFPGVALPLPSQGSWRMRLRA